MAKARHLTHARRLLLLIGAVFALTGEALAISREEFCKSAEGINQIKAFLACQEDSKLAACSSLTTQWAGRPMSPEDRKRYHEMIRRNQVPLTDAMARKLHALWRRHRRLENPEARLEEMNLLLTQSHDHNREKERNALQAAIKAARNPNDPKNLVHPVFEPRIKELNGQIYDIANLPFSELPKAYREMNQRYARDVLRRYQSSEWTTQDANYLSDIVKSGLRSRLKDDLLQGLGSTAQEVVASELDTVRSLAHEFAANWFGIQSFNRAGGGGSGFPILGLIIAQIHDATPVSCSQELGAPFITSEHQNGSEGCKDVLQIKGNVLRFLDLPEQEQLKLLALRNVRVCDFYFKLHQTLFEQPQLIHLQCDAGGLELRGRWRDGRTLDHKIVYHPGSLRSKKLIKQINLLGGSDWKPPVATPIEVGTNGEITGFKTSSDQQTQTISFLRLYLMDAQNCCTSGDPRFKSSCLASYNGETPPPVEQPAEKLLSRPPRKTNR